MLDCLPGLIFRVYLYTPMCSAPKTYDYTRAIRAISAGVIYQPSGLQIELTISIVIAIFESG